MDAEDGVGGSRKDAVPDGLSEREMGDSSTTAGPTEMSWKNWAKEWCTCIVTVLIVVISWKVFVLDCCLRSAKAARTKKQTVEPQRTEQ